MVLVAVRDYSSSFYLHPSSADPFAQWQDFSVVICALIINFHPWGRRIELPLAFLLCRTFCSYIYGIISHKLAAISLFYPQAG